MALESSRLSAETIAALLLEQYGLRAVSVEKTQLGSANCFLVSCREGDYFLKEFQSAYSPEDLTREVELCAFLRSRDFPAPRFLRTQGGAACCTHAGRAVSLQERIQGTAYGYEELPSRLLPCLAKTLGRLQRTLRGFPLPVQMGEEWLSGYDPEREAARYYRLLAQVSRSPEDPYREELMTDLQYKRELGLRCEAYRNAYADVTYTASHGDYQGCQVIWDGDSVRAVIDFSAAATLPAVWEVMRSFVQSARGSRETLLDAEGLCAYVRAYLQEAPLSRTDLRAMPYVYLFQLARSAYGYREYLTTDSEDRESLLRFAFWRTALCRELEAKAQSLSEALVRLQ